MTDLSHDHKLRTVEPGRRLQVPSKKKLEADVDQLMAEVQLRETQLKDECIVREDELRAVRGEKEATLIKRKMVDTELKTLNQTITQRMTDLSRLQSSLHYNTEQKHSDAIRKLEWNLKVQNFKLSEEKKIVAEIDSLKRSRKLLEQYMTMKKGIDENRDRQRLMREERDKHFHQVTKLKAQEEEIKKHNQSRKSRADVLRKEINQLYEKKRTLVAEFKKQRDVYQETVKRQRAESLRKRVEERRALDIAQQKEMEEFEAAQKPFEEERNLCNTLTAYLQKIVPSPESSMGRGGNGSSCTTTVPPPQIPGPASAEDGTYRLLRKSDAVDDFPISCARRSSKKHRRSRKLSMTKPVTHTPHVIAQFASLNLCAPSNLGEVAASLEQLQGRKLHYEEKAQEYVRLSCSSALPASAALWSFLEEGAPKAEDLQSVSEADVSATESVVCQMSRQASKTESCDSASDTRPTDTVMEEILADMCCQTKTDFHDMDKLSLSDCSEIQRSESVPEVSSDEALARCSDCDKETYVTTLSDVPNNLNVSCDISVSGNNSDCMQASHHLGPAVPSIAEEDGVCE